MANDSQPPLPSHDFDQITSLGKYKVQRKVGSGGMGAVYLAVDQQLKRTVALKVLPKDKASNQVLVRRFKAEGQAGAQLEHPNIVAVYESGEIDGYLYLAMEFVEGVDAFELLRKRGVLPAKRSLDIIKQVTLALQHAHERLVVHRDIKPSNLMIRERDGVVKLADMGLARIIEDDGESAITKAGTTVGTVDYMSPEQGRDSKAADIRSDIYSLGCTWYHLLAGKAPFPDGDLMNKLRAHALQPVPDPRNWNENIPAGVVAVLQRMMAKKPDDRYQTPAQLLADLNSPAILRGDFSADQLQMLGAAHSAEESADAEDQDDNADPGSKGPRRTRPAKSKTNRNGKTPSPRPHRADVEPEEDAEEDQPATPQKSKPKSRKPAGREEIPPRVVLDPASAETDGGKRAKTDRILPGRIDKPLLSEPPSTRIDPNTLKLWLLGSIVVVALGGILYSLKRYSDSSVTTHPVANPYATGETGEVPPVAPAATAGDKSPSTGTSTAPQEPPAIVMEDPTVPVVPPTSIVAVVPSNTTPAIPADLDRTPFAGEFPFTATGTEMLPPWVWQSRIQPDSKPAFTIRRSRPADGEARNLAETLTTVRGDTVIEFADAGPHDISAFDMKQPGRWILRGTDGVSPVLILKGRNATIGVLQGTLILEGVHLVLLSDHPGPGIRVGAATLAVRNSTITHMGAVATELIVAEAGGRVLLENSMIRATGTCRPLVLKGPKTTCVAGQSLLIAGNASAIQIESTDSPGDQRSVTLVTTACLSGLSGLSCFHTGKQPPASQFKLHRSVLAYIPGHSADAIGVQFQGWSKAAESLESPRVPFVTWAVEKSAFVGWPHWAQLGFADGTAPVDVRDDESWRAFWRQPTPTGVLIPVGASLQSVSEAGALASGEQVQIGLAGIATELAEAGPKWSDLPDLPRSILSHLIAFGQCPRMPASLDSPDSGTPLRFDLKKPTLGRFINSDECPDGSTVIAFGSGLRTIDPFVVRQKRVQITFEQSEGTPLMIQPGYKTEPNAARPSAWFAVEDGQLTISNGSFRLMASATRTYPERFLQMTGGLATIRNCRVEGVDAAWPLIDTLPSEGHAPPQLLIDQSLLAGAKSLVRVGAAETLLEIRGSILSSSAGVAVTLDTGASGSQCLLNGSTLSAAKSVYQVLPVGMGEPVGLFSRESVFQGGSVMALETDASAVQWWGMENAFASGMKTFLMTRGAAGSQDFSRDWVQGWGAGHELLPVSGPNTTILPSPPANLADVIPDAFQLHVDCEAAQSGPTGAGLGAVIARVGPTRPVAPSKNSPKAPVKNAPVGPQKDNPGF